MPIVFKTLIVIEVLMLVGLGLFRVALAPAYRSVVSPTIAVLALLTPAVALLCGNFYLFCGYLALVVAFNSRSRGELAANYAFLLPLMPALSQETGVGGVYLLAISAIMAMSFGALIGFLTTSARRNFAQPRGDVAVLLLIGMFIFIYNRDFALTSLVRGLTANIIGFVGPYLLISRGITSRVQLERLLLRLSLAGVLAAMVAIFQARKQWLLSQAYYEALHVPIPFGTATLSMRGGFLRTGGLLGDYSAAGVFFAAVLTMMPMLRPRFRPVGFWAVAALLVGGLVATQSRGAWIAAIVGLLFVLAYRGQWAKAALLAATGIAAQTAVWLFASGALASIAGRTAEATGSVSYRRQLATRGFDQIVAHPLLGQSTEQLIGNLPDLVQGQHIVDFVNAHLFVAMSAGVPLFLVWCWIWLAPVVEGWRHPARRGPDSDLAGIPGALIVPVMVAITATSIMDRNLNWPLIAVALAGPCFALARRGSTAEDAAPRPLLAGIGRDPRPAPRPAIA